MNNYQSEKIRNKSLIKQTTSQNNYHLSRKLDKKIMRVQKYRNVDSVNMEHSFEEENASKDEF